MTVTGVAGVGKTRLALHAAARRGPEFAGGAWLIEVAHLRDPALLPHTVAYTLGIPDNQRDDPVVRLAEALRDAHLLLVLDNCEHLVRACADLARTLLAEVPRVQILATSREALRVCGEQVLRLGPLPVPERAGSDLAATTLFAQRAAAAVPSFTVSDENRDQVLDLCRRLDGIPLAIELAAARLRALSVAQLRERLADPLRLLTRGPRAELPHQRTLRASLDWSYDLCLPAERVLWARLSVFAGPFDLAAAVEVGSGGGLDAADVAGILDSLVGKSVVLREESAGRTGYRLLETLRRYGLDRLREAGEESRLGRALADRCLRLAERAERDWFGPRQAECFAWVGRERPNLRAAL
ncbi:MAG TPA: AAA family ATPase, partial [Rugosimonospora sp.]|nr:AAA family ATPase [Rugosimonospora sp.]